MFTYPFWHTHDPVTKFIFTSTQLSQLVRELEQVAHGEVHKKQLFPIFK